MRLDLLFCQSTAASVSLGAVLILARFSISVHLFFFFSSRSVLIPTSSIMELEGVDRGTYDPPEWIQLGGREGRRDLLDHLGSIRVLQFPLSSCGIPGVSCVC